MKLFQQPPILCNENPIDDKSVFFQPQFAHSAVGNQYGEEFCQGQAIHTKPDECFEPLREKQAEQNTSKENKQSSGHVKMIQFLHVRAFVNKLMAGRKLLNKLQKYHYDIINDPASSFNLQLLKKNAFQLKPFIKETEMTKTLTEQIQESPTFQSLASHLRGYIQLITKLFLSIPLVGPESKVKVFWDCLMAVARMYFIVLVPLDLAWDEQNYMYDYLLIPTIISLLLLILDFFFSLFQSYYHQGQIVTSRKLIARHLITRAYGLELASTIILISFLIKSAAYGEDLNLYNEQYYLLTLLTFVQYGNIAQLRQKLEDALNLSKAASSIVQLIKLFILLFYVIHLFACIWYWVGNFSNDIGISWLERREIQNQSFGVQYLNSFYYSTVTMFTVGYGDITPNTIPELICSIIFMMVCSVQLSYSVSTVGAIIDRISSDKEEQQRKFHIINTYMKKKKLTYDLQVKVREYLNYYWQDKNIEVTEQENEILGQLPSRLKDQVIFQANTRLLHSVKLLKNYFTSSFREALARKIHSVCLAPENTVDLQKLVNDPLGVCFLESGKIKIVVENEGEKKFSSHISTIRSGESFGIFSFISGQPAIEKYVTTRFTKLLVLPRTAFIETIKQYPADYEMFKKLQDELESNTLHKYFPIKCSSCESVKHKAIYCPLLQYRPDKEKLIKSIQISHEQSREKKDRYERAQVKKFNTLLHQKQISQRALKIQESEAVFTLLLLYDQDIHEEYSPPEEPAAQGQVNPQSNSDKKSKTILTANRLDELMKKTVHRHQPSHIQANVDQKPKNQPKSTLILQNDRKKESVKARFQNLVRLAVKKRWQLRDKEQGKMIENLLFTQLERLQKQRELLDQFYDQLVEKSDIDISKLIDEIEYLELFIKKNLNAQQFNHLDIDRVKQMTTFHPEFNLECVLGNLLRINSLQPEQHSKISGIRSKLARYMIFTQYFIEKYHQITNSKMNQISSNYQKQSRPSRAFQKSRAPIALLGSNRLHRRK